MLVGCPISASTEIFFTKEDEKEECIWRLG
jgi:hypothetical protein